MVPSFRWNLIPVSYLDKSIFLYSFRNNIFNLSLNSYIVVTSSLFYHDNLYFLDIIATYNESLNVESCGTKCKIDNNISGALWHKPLGHITKNIVERLVSDEILESIDFTNFDVCVEYIKGKPKQRNLMHIKLQMSYN